MSNFVLMMFIGLLFFGFSNHSVAFDDPSILTQPRMMKRPPRIARVRLPISISDYEKILVKKVNGAVEAQYRVIGKRSYRLRARIDKLNHFYVGKWHIETQPIKWDLEKKYWSVKLRFHKVYGEGEGLEEWVGTTKVSGLVEGKNLLYEFKGRKNIKFSNTMGHPIAEISLGPSGKKVLSKSSTPKETL